MKHEYRDLAGVLHVTDSRTLAEARDEAAARIETEYAEHIARGVVYAGKTFQIDPASTQDMATIAVRIAVGIPLESGFAWRAADNSFLPVTEQEALGLGAAAASRVYALRKALWAAKDAARAAKDNDAADAVKAAWPK